MAQTAVFDVIDKLVDLLAADATLTTNKVLIVDGQPLNDFDEGLTLVVGGAEKEDDGRTASMQQTWANSTTVEKDERGSVFCTLWCLRGDTALRNLRAELKTVLDAVNAVLRSNQATPSGLSAHVLWWQLADVSSFSQYQNEDGSLVRVSFTVDYRARMYL